MINKQDRAHFYKFHAMMDERRIIQVYFWIFSLDTIISAEVNFFATLIELFDLLIEHKSNSCNAITPKFKIY